MNPRKQLFYIAAAALLGGIALVYSIVGSPVVLWHNHQLAESLIGLTDETITLEQAVPFSWDEVYSFAPYTSLEEIRQTIGTDSYNLTESTSEGMIQLIFLKDGAVTAAVCGYPDQLGYQIVLTAGAEDAHLTYGQDGVFAVRQEAGVVCLEPAAE